MSETLVERSALDKILYGSDPRSEKLYTGDPPRLGTWEVAHYLGVERSRIARWLDELENGKPVIDPPAQRTKAGPFWTLEQVQAKAAEMYRDAGSPLGPKGLEKWLEQRRAYRRQREAQAA